MATPPPPRSSSSSSSRQGTPSERSVLLANAEMGMAVAQEERDAAVAQLASTRAELAAVTRRAAQAQAEADAARSAAAAQEATPRTAPGGDTNAARVVGSEQDEDAREALLNEVNALADAMAETKRSLEAERDELAKALAEARSAAANALAGATSSREAERDARVVELERSLRAARALAGPAARTLTEAVHGTRTELAALREAVEACEAEWWTDEIRDGLERIVAAHAARSRGADAARQAVLSRLRDEADGRAAAEGAARAARAHAAELAGMVEVCERKLQRCKDDHELACSALAAENELLRQRVRDHMHQISNYLSARAPVAEGCPGDSSSARTRGHGCGGPRKASGEVFVCGCAGAASDERDSVVAELHSHLSAARARLIEQDRELSRARRAAMATESMSRQIHTAAEQTEMAARRGMTSVEEAADLETARLRLDLASSEAQRSMLERHLAAAREELDSKQSLAERVVRLESRIVSMGASAAQAKKELEQRVVVATTESRRLSAELERAVRAAEALEARVHAEVAARQRAEAALAERHRSPPGGDHVITSNGTDTSISSTRSGGASHRGGVSDGEYRRAVNSDPSAVEALRAAMAAMDDALLQT